MTDILEEARKKAWSIESMEAHGAAGRATHLVGVEKIGTITYKYYQDKEGDFWYWSSAGSDLPERTMTRKKKRPA